MITGYWFLENSDAEWSAPDSLVAFIEQAREDNKPIVYIGVRLFGFSLPSLKIPWSDYLGSLEVSWCLILLR